jgi:diguanylate cyclase (GGDEF)-like protein
MTTTTPGLTEAEHSSGQPDGSESTWDHPVVILCVLVAASVCVVTGEAISGAVGRVMIVLALLVVVSIGVRLALTLGRERALNQRLRQRNAATQRLLDRTSSQIAMAERIDRALVVCDTPLETLQAASGLIAAITDGFPARLLLASGTRSLAWEIKLGGGRVGSVNPLQRTVTCAALRTLRTAITYDSSSPGACHHLDPEDAVSAVCMPVPGSREFIGLLEIEGPIGQPPEERLVEQLQMVALRLGQRLAALRAVLVDEAGEATDPMTGLAIRDEVFRRIPEILRHNPTTSLAIADIDGWETFTDRFGPKESARALRLVGTTLHSTLRPGDAVTRIGDGRFLMVLPRCGSVDAHRAMERIRERLVLATAGNDFEPVTLSIGLADTETETGFEDLLDAAEIGVEMARLDGGNRALIGSS